MGRQTQSRQDRSEQIQVDHIEQLDYDSYLMRCKNEKGETRSITLSPATRMSSSPDMKHRSGNGHVGKYLRALASEDPVAKAKLVSAIEHDLSQTREEISDLLDEVKELQQKGGRLMEAQQSL